MSPSGFQANFSSNVYTDDDSNDATPDSGMTPNSPADTLTLDASQFDDEGHASENEDRNGGRTKRQSKSRRSSKGSTSESRQESKEKRKRSRVTPDQLRHLERIFQSERAPIAPRRKEISDLLGMNERQTQIWFQNRRAKEKTLQQKQALARRESVESAPESVPGIPSAPDVDVYQLIHENEPVTLIPCTDLTIGTWRRINTAPGIHDLLAYVCEIRKCLSWYIQSSGHAFKMDMPFDTITKVELTRIGPQTAVVTLKFSKVPAFSLESAATPGESKKGGMRSWEACGDWTEGKQASVYFSHKVQGSLNELNYLVESIEKNNALQNMPIPRKPVYDRDHLPPLTMEIPAPPMAGLAAPAFNLPSISGRHSLSPMDTHPKRLSYDSSHAPSPSSYSLDTSLSMPAPHSASTSTFSQGHGYPHQTQHQQHAPHSYLGEHGMYTTQNSTSNSNTYNGHQHDVYNQYGSYAEPRLSSSNVNHNHHNPYSYASHSADYHTHAHNHFSHSGSRSHTSSPYPPQQGPPASAPPHLDTYAGNPRALPSYNTHHEPVSTPARLSPLSLYSTPSHSPPLLTTPHGAGSCGVQDDISGRRFQDLGAGVHGGSGPSGLRAPSGMPGLMYETDDAFHSRRSI
ncbi:hypothetical protein D9619_004513 [Psilocybe cf. subviscida]|uniref:Homeobox domain-containing protein n=1 Tax=Psilocybe cf. subviscida TaxID=2480587 RepID=A0A8H5F8R3_9AGAR|nr:hypothetical protein D9619_004513 [Psilocybe cf. subviscida]